MKNKMTEQFKNVTETVERGKIDTPNTQIHDYSLSLLATGTAIKCCGVNLVLWVQTSPLSEILGKIDTPNPQIHDCSLFLLATGTSIKCCEVKLKMVVIIKENCEENQTFYQNQFHI